MPFSRHKSSAFSLLELLVSVTIMMLMVGGALAGYTSYTEKQRLVAAAEKLESGLREAQNMARTGYLGTCDELGYVDFSMYIDATDGLIYRIRLHCAEDATDTYRSANTKYETVGQDFILNGDLLSLKFYPYGNLSNDVSRTLSSTRTNYQAVFEIDQGGGIKVTYN